MEMLVNWWENATSGLRIALIMLLSGALIQVVYDLVLYARLVLWKPQSKNVLKPGVSVVICARNEERNLRDLIPALMDQDYPDFELVVVDDSSWDDSGETLKAYAVTYPNVKFISLDEDKQMMSGKKFALTMGIKGASKEIVLLTDADCAPISKHWISLMAEPFSNPSTEVVLGVSPYGRKKGFLNRIIRFDAAQIAVNYLSFALIGIPYMGVGRNMAYRKELFFKNGGFRSHLHIASGDDDLFIAEVAKRKNTEIVILPEAQTVSEPKTGWKAWSHQKRRHFTTAPHYRLGIKLLLGLWPLSFFLLWTGALALAIVHSEFLIAGSILLLRYVVHLATFIGAFKKTGQSDLLLGMPLWELMVWIINPILWIWNLLATPRTWK